MSRLCHEPRVAVAVIEAMLTPYRGSGRLRVLQPYRPVGAEIDGDRVRAARLEHRDGAGEVTVVAPYVLDATETGELLPLTGTEYVTGFESQGDTGEPSAPAEAQPMNMQAVSVCFAIDHVDGDHTIDRPGSYEFWRSYQPGFWGDRLLSGRCPHPRTLEIVERSFTPNPDDDPLLVEADQRLNPGDANLWTFRRIAARRNFADGAYASDITLVNWPMIDYLEAWSSTCRTPPGTWPPPASSPARCCTGCRPRRRASTAGPGFPACACGAMSQAVATTAWPRPPTSASRAASAPCTPWPSRTCRSQCAETRAR